MSSDDAIDCQGNRVDGDSVRPIKWGGSRCARFDLFNDHLVGPWCYDCQYLDTSDLYNYWCEQSEQSNNRPKGGQQ